MEKRANLSSSKVIMTHVLTPATHILHNVKIQFINFWTFQMLSLAGHRILVAFGTLSKWYFQHTVHSFYVTNAIFYPCMQVVRNPCMQVRSLAMFGYQQPIVNNYRQIWLGICRHTFRKHENAFPSSPHFFHGPNFTVPFFFYELHGSIQYSRSYFACKGGHSISYLPVISMK